MRPLVLLALFVGCAAAPGRKDPEPRPAKPPTARPLELPAGFRVVGAPRVEEAYLDPEPAWRALRSRITMLQADALARGEEICVTFQENAVHSTDRSGARRTWRLPEGLLLSGGPRHLVLGPDSEARLFAGDRSQIPLGDEVTIVVAKVRSAGGSVEEFRLVVKGRSTIRSISTAG